MQSDAETTRPAPASSLAAPCQSKSRGLPRSPRWSARRRTVVRRSVLCEHPVGPARPALRRGRADRPPESVAPSARCRAEDGERRCRASTFDGLVPDQRVRAASRARPLPGSAHDAASRGIAPMQVAEIPRERAPSSATCGLLTRAACRREPAAAARHRERKKPQPCASSSPSRQRLSNAVTSSPNALPMPAMSPFYGQ